MNWMAFAGVCSAVFLFTGGAAWWLRRSVPGVVNIPRRTYALVLSAGAGMTLGLAAVTGLLAGARTASAVAGTLPVSMSGSPYSAVSVPSAAGADKAGGNSNQALPGGTPHGTQAGDLNVLVERLGERLKAQPGDAAGWALYARTLQELGRHAHAVEAYQRASTLSPRDVDVLAELSQAQYSAAGNTWATEARATLDKAARLDAANPQVLWLKGSQAFASRRYAESIAAWEALLPKLSADSPQRRQAEMGLEEARALRDGRDPAEAVRKLAKRDSATANLPSDQKGNDAAFNGRGSTDPEVQSLARELREMVGRYK